MTKQQAIHEQVYGMPTYDFPEKMMARIFCRHVPFGGHEGASGLQKYLAQLSNVGDGELVFMILFSTRLRRQESKKTANRATGRACDMPFVWEFRFAPDGKLTYLREYNDTAAIGGTFDI